MSVQLIVYPQSYNGAYNAVSSSSTEFLVNGINFNDLNNTGTYTSSISVPYVDTLTNAPPAIVNTWYRFRNNTAGTPSFPSALTGDVILKSSAGATGSRLGIYQRLSNLVIGQQYTLTINLSAATTGLILTKIAQGTTIYEQGNSSANTTQVTLNFTAASTDSTIMIVYYNTIVATATITSLSIQPVVGAVPSGASNVLDNGQVILDLYEDEDLPLTLSVDNFKNVAEKVQSYSKAFKLPATKRNNRIFYQMFEITRSYDGVIFNPYRRTQCVLKQDGFILFEGFLRLLEVTDKEDEISYNVNLYSEVVALADFLKDKTFAELDFTELQHPYNKTQIKYSWNDGTTGITYLNPNTSGFRDAYRTVKYPFVDWNHQYTLDGSGFPVLPNLESSFRPFINVKYLVDRIFQDSPFTYTSDFFDADDFGNLYMDFNWGASNSPVVFDTTGSLTLWVGYSIPGTFGTIEWDFMPAGPSLSSSFGYSAGVFTAPEDNQVYTIDYSFQFAASGVGTLDVEWVVDGVPVNATTITGNFLDYSGSFTTGVGGVPSLSAGDTIFCRVKDSGGLFAIVGVLVNPPGVSNTPSLLTITTTSSQTTSSTLLQTLRGEIEQWEFLKGFITMFNLVTLPDEDNPNNIKIEPYQDVFINSASSVQIDWTDKIDVSEMKLSPLTDLKKDTIFKFVEDEDDFCFNQYKSATTGHLYGSQKYMTTNEFNILQGLEEIEAAPFAATFIKPLDDDFPDFIIPTLYAMNQDGETEGFENSPRLMYNNGIKTLTSCTYEIPEQNGVSGNAAEADFLQFSHLSSIPTLVTTPPATSDTRDFHFGICQLINAIGSPTTFNLFNMHWLPYYSELYNPDTRTMVIKVNLTPADINTFKFNDTVYIKNRVFRVNKIDYKPNDLATVEFILIP